MINRTKIEQLLTAIGHRLRRPSMIVIVGSTASMLSGQDDRQTPDIDIWYPMSDFDPGDMRQAVEAAGLRYDPRGEIGAEDIYLQILRPASRCTLPRSGPFILGLMAISALPCRQLP